MEAMRWLVTEGTDKRQVIKPKTVISLGSGRVTLRKSLITTPTQREGD
jgi:hypothetical protein